MSAVSHVRTASQGTAQSASSFQLILEHILSYPGSYEIPLRNMYMLNSAARAQPFNSASSRSCTPIANAWDFPSIPQTPWQEGTAATAQFTSSLMAQISQLPAQQCSLPPVTFTRVVRDTFPHDLHRVDFPQALTALDYLKGLETRRRKEFASALGRLGIEVNTTPEEVSQSSPGCASWLRDMTDKERKIENSYTSLYISLRRWILINELSLQPFNRHNCYAMLNTLYPPVVLTQPTPMLTTGILEKQRAGFIRYIQSVEKTGPQALTNLIRQGKREGEENGWPAVAESLERYLRLANHFIEECQQTSRESFAELDDPEKRKGHKVDSGVYCESEKRPSTAGSFATNYDKPLPLPPSPTESRIPRTPNKGGSTLERIARELKRMRRSHRVEVEEIIRPEEKEVKEPKMRSLKKIRSLGALSDLRHSNLSSITLGGRIKIPAFDKEEMRQQRLAYERSVASRGQLHSHEL